MVVLCALQLGCSSLDDAGPTADAAESPATVLSIVGDAERVPLLPSGMTSLKVRYLTAAGQPIAGQTVEFALSETISGASLSPAQVATDEDGVAQTELRAGNSKARFTVRASAEGAEPVSFDISVGDAVMPTALVKVSYEGERDVASFSLTLVRGMDCDHAEVLGPASSANSHVLYRLEQGVEFELSGGSSYAVVAWAKDATNAKVASGCESLRAPITADAAEAHLELDVPLVDVPLALGESYAVALNLDLQKPLANLASVAIDAVDAALPSGATPEATLYLDAVQANLAPAAANELRRLREATTPQPRVDQALQLLLEATESGPLRLASELAALVAATGPSCTLQATYKDGGAGSLSVARLFALPNPALGATAKEVPLSGALSGEATLEARYDEAAAAVRIDSVALQIGLGSYANVLLEAARGDAQSFATRLAAAHGCGSLGNLVSTRGLPVAPVDAVASCEQAVGDLIDRISASWSTLDADYASIWLSGALPVHDRNDDGVVDDLGPAELSGSWGTSASDAADDEVGATLRVPATTALVAL